MIVYFDSGTSNTRAYLLDDDLKLIAETHCGIGSRDSAIQESNAVLVESMYALYAHLLENSGLRDSDIDELYASGMVTCPYGLHEVPHLILPISARDFINRLYPYEESTRFRRTIHLVPGMRTHDAEIDQLNNMRGEEIEMMGLVDRLNARFGDRRVAVMLPGSHTHVTIVRAGCFEGIISNMTGELFRAIREATILGPVLKCEVARYDVDMVRMGVRNLKKYGFDRAIYICHAMRMFNRYTPEQRVSYAEGVIMGGVCQSVDAYCAEFWPDLTSCVIAADPRMGEVYRNVMLESACIREIELWSPEADSIPALDGMRSILRNR